MFKDESFVEIVEGGSGGATGQASVRRPGLKTRSSGENGEDLGDSDSSEEDIQRMAEMGNHVGRDDEVTMSMLRDNKNLAEPRTCQGSFGPNGQFVSAFAVLQSLLMIIYQVNLFVSSGRLHVSCATRSIPSSRIHVLLRVLVKNQSTMPPSITTP